MRLHSSSSPAGLGFLLAPQVIIDMNFNVKPDSYHLFMGRFSGWLMVSFSYFLYAGLLGDNAFSAATFRIYAMISNPSLFHATASAPSPHIYHPHNQV
jgi:hypothetical protein